MKISYNWLQTYFEKPLPKPEELVELFSLRAFDVEGVAKLENGDTMLDIKVLPDRACYALSHRGIARELSAILAVPLKVREEVPIVESSIPDPDIGIEEPKLCTKFVGRRMEQVQVGESPQWLQDRLTSIGQRPINNIVDATNFVMFDIGRPLHAFDADKVKGKLTMRLAKKGEALLLLDDKQLQFRGGELVIADESGPVALGGIKGGKTTGVDKHTTSLILEAANWNSSYVRKASAAMGVRTDASKRFENRLSPLLAEEGMDALTRLIASIAETTDTKIGKQVVVSFEKISERTLPVDADFISGTLGISLGEKKVTEALSRLGVACTGEGKKLLAHIPPERLDLEIPEDIAEEVGRIYGYEKIAGVVAPTPKTAPKPSKEFYYTEKIKNVLVDMGFSEVSLYTMVAKGDIEIAKPLASDKAFLRTNLSFGMERSVKMNILNAPLLGLEEIKEFEIGKVFTDSGEFLSLAVGVSLIKKAKGKTSEGVVKEVFEALSAALVIPLRPSVTNLQSLAVGEVILENLFEALPEPKSYADLKFSAPSETKYEKFSVYPFIVRDVALFVSPLEKGETRKLGASQDLERPSSDAKGVQLRYGGPESSEAGVVFPSAESVARIIKENAGELVVRGPELFDEFAKDGKKSLAFRLVFQSFDRTLQDEEVNSVMEKVYAALKGKGWEVR
ncbi:MAG: phenylalanine--tRNA ligase subunit beta [bacterium]|nr:phenylalanine--tRNA ligase subunit beta [bacterium]